MTENQEWIYDAIELQIRMGLDSPDDIRESVMEQVADEGLQKEITEAWVIEQLTDEYNALEAQSKSWPTPTDTQKLINAFNELCTQNIMALHCAGFDITSGEDDVIALELDLIKLKKSSDGYCFYHEQDLETVLENDGGSLFITFQKVENEDNQVAIEIGKKVISILNKHGLKTNWNETVNKRIEILNFTWQKIYTDDDDWMDYDMVLNLLVTA